MCNAVTNTVTNVRRNNVRRFVQTRPDQTRLFLRLFVLSLVNQFQVVKTVRGGLATDWDWNIR